MDLVLALNAGCAGFATLHANSARDALEKLVGYCVLAGENVAVSFVRRAVATVADLVVFLRRTPAGRRVEEIVSVPPQLEAGVFTTETLYAPEGPLLCRGGATLAAAAGGRP